MRTFGRVDGSTVVPVFFVASVVVVIAVVTGVVVVVVVIVAVVGPKVVPKPVEPKPVPRVAPRVVPKVETGLVSVPVGAAAAVVAVFVALGFVVAGDAAAGVVIIVLVVLAAVGRVNPDVAPSVGLACSPVDPNARDGLDSLADAAWVVVRVVGAVGAAARSVDKDGDAAKFAPLGLGLIVEPAPNKLLNVVVPDVDIVPLRENVGCVCFASVCAGAVILLVVLVVGWPNKPVALPPEPPNLKVVDGVVIVVVVAPAAG